MPHDNESTTETWLNISSIEAKRGTFRNLLVACLGLSITAGVLQNFFGLPEGILMAVAFEEEMMPQWRLAVGGLAALVLFGVVIWGAFDLWRYRRSGVAKFFALYFLPVFLLFPGTVVSTPLVNFLYQLGNLVAGLLLFMCLTQPEIFQAKPEPVASTNSGPNSSPKQLEAT